MQVTYVCNGTKTYLSTEGVTVSTNCKSMPSLSCDGARDITKLVFIE